MIVEEIMMVVGGTMTAEKITMRKGITTKAIVIEKIIIETKEGTIVRTERDAKEVLVL